MTEIHETLHPPLTRRTLSPAQQAQLEKRLRGVAAPAPEIPRRAANGPAPLSSAQQRLWFYEQLEPGQPTYNVPIVVTLRGPLNVAALETSLNAVVQRHAILRTTFATVDGEAVQNIAPALSIPLPLVEVQALSEADIEALLVAEARAPFDLTRGPLLRARLLRRALAEHLLQLTFHHIIFDGWSLGVFLRELGALYAGYVNGQPPALPELPIEYADFAAWQRRELQEEVLQRQLAYWKQRLSGALPVLNLPTDRPRPPVQSHNGTLYRFAFPHALYINAQTFAQQEGVSLFMLVLAAFEVLLYRYTGQADMLIGIPVANRTRHELEGLIGFFVNTLALRGNLSGAPTFREVLKQVRQRTLEAYEHQDLPFERLVEALQPERDLSRNPLFQVMCAFQDTTGTTFSLPGITATVQVLDNRTALFDLSLDIEVTSTGLHGSFEYNTDLFDAATIQRLAGHLGTLLENAVAHPEQTIAALPMMSPDEYRQVLELGRGPTVHYPDPPTVHQMFEAQVARTPDAPAVSGTGQTLSYAELNRRANQLAHYLRALGVGPETPVGLYFERTPEMIVSLLGILKAGGMYVPLDPAYPQARLALILDDAQVRFLVTQRDLAETLSVYPEHLICLDTDGDTIARYSDANPTTNITGANGAYIIYTSGSTGVPKGVVVPHGALRNFILAINAAYHIRAGERVLQFSSISFDAAAEEIYVTLTQGATLMLRTDAMIGSVMAFWQACADWGIHVLDLPTAYWRELANGFPTLIRMGGSLPPTLRLVIFGGEKALPDDVQMWHAHVGSHVELINGYGPTETTVAVTVHDLTTAEAVAAAQDTVPIGRPIANVHTYVLDPRLQPVPLGVPGELYIGGACLARGYLNQPELTATKFLPDPFSDAPGARMYKTGDLARYRADGALEYLGRNDEQVKIRGYRVELGEIEAALRHQPGVGAAAVVTAVDEGGQTQLVAHIAHSNGHSVAGEHLREALRQTLPPYMIPASFVIHDTLPLTPAGKVDRQTLAVSGIQREARTDYVAPRTVLEEQLAAIWAEAFHVTRVGIHDDFFELGGHSLQAMQLIARIAMLLHVRLPLKMLFLHPTIAELAAALEQQPTATASLPTTIAPAMLPYLTIEPRPLLSLFHSGRLAPVDAATLGYLDRTTAARDVLLRELLRERPLFTDVIETPLGRNAIILLPRFEDELYQDRQDLLAQIMQAVKLAEQLGARAVSLAGLIPSATDYGRAIPAVAAPALTTGHATTSATVILSVEKILRESGRRLEDEQVGMLGLGSVGRAALRLMLRTLPHPRTLLLCDLREKRAVLEDVQQEIRADFGFTGEVRLLESSRQVPEAFYAASLILGATNTPEVLDIAQVRPGTLILDDSSLRCYSTATALHRLQTQGDILFSEGGILKSPAPIPQVAYVLKAWSDVPIGYLRRDPYDITGCVLAALLLARYADLEPTLGVAGVAASEQRYRRLKALGFEAADLHNEQYTLEKEVIAGFRQRFGTHNEAEG